MERIDAGQDFLALVDFAHTPNALDKALQACRPMVREGGRLIAVFGSAGLRDREKRRLMAEVAAQRADFTILTAEDPRTESLDDILATMAAATTAAGGVEGETFIRVPDRGEALYAACQMARQGDVVIACGKGHEQSMAFGTVEYAWDDREALRAALQDAAEDAADREAVMTGRFVRGEWLFVVALLLFAAGLRIVGVTNGQPDMSAFPTDAARDMVPYSVAVQPDEFLFVARPYRMLLTRQLNPQYFENPSFLINLNFFTYLLTGEGRGVSYDSFKGIDEREHAPFRFYVIGRMYSASGWTAGGGGALRAGAPGRRTLRRPQRGLAGRGGAAAGAARPLHDDDQPRQRLRGGGALGGDHEPISPALAVVRRRRDRGGAGGGQSLQCGGGFAGRLLRRVDLDRAGSAALALGAASVGCCSRSPLC